MAEFDDKYFISKNKKGEWIIVRKGAFSSGFSNDFNTTREVGRIVTVEDAAEHLNQLEREKLFWVKASVLSPIIVSVIGVISYILVN